MPVRFPQISDNGFGGWKCDTYEGYALCVTDHQVSMFDLPRDADGSWKGRKAGLAAYAAKIMAEVDPAAYDDIEDLLDAMLAVERPEFNYA